MIAMEALLEKVYGKMTKSKENVNNDVMELNKESSFLSNDSTNNDIFNYDDVDELLNALESDDINSVQTLSSFQKPLATGAPNEEFLDKNVNPYSSKKHHKAAHGAVVGVNIRTNEPKSESASSIGEETCKQPCVSITNNAAALAPPSKDVVVSAVSVNQNGRTTSEDGQSFLSAEWSKGCIHNSSKELIEVSDVPISSL